MSEQSRPVSRSVCPTCGSPVRVVSADEGTSHYEPDDSFDRLAEIAQRILDTHYPADLPLVCDRNSPDPGARLTAALRDCLEVHRA